MTANIYSCYLLTPIPKTLWGKKTYVGFTTIPSRRLRQHNGEIKGGAKRTRNHQWEMCAVVSGFPTQRDALIFEWSWQHPLRSRKTRDLVGMLKGKRGIGVMGSLRRKLIELVLILNCEPFSHMTGLRVLLGGQHFRDMAESFDLTLSWPNNGMNVFTNVPFTTVDSMIPKDDVSGRRKRRVLAKSVKRRMVSLSSPVATAMATDDGFDFIEGDDDDELSDGSDSMIDSESSEESIIDLCSSPEPSLNAASMDVDDDNDDDVIDLVSP